MSKSLIIGLLLIPLFLVSACSPLGAQNTDVNDSQTADCPVTRQQEPPYAPPESYAGNEANEGFFWYGSDELRTMLPVDGVWEGLPSDEHGYTQKLFWWADGYVWTEEPDPAFLLTGKRLDGPAPEIETSEATNAYSEQGSSILTGLTFPSLGCWQITGNYKGHELVIVVNVKP